MSAVSPFIQEFALSVTQSADNHISQCSSHMLFYESTVAVPYYSKSINPIKSCVLYVIS
jgi:hypothetical protein